MMLTVNVEEPVISTEGRNLGIVGASLKSKISPFGRNDRLFTAGRSL